MGRPTLAAIGLAAAVGALACTSVPRPSSASVAPTVMTECRPTIAHMTPPTAVFEFFVSGSSSPNARDVFRTLNWYGNEALWVILPPNGETPVGLLGDKIPPYRLKRGQVQWEARRLDGPGTVPRQKMGGDAYGDIGFVAGGPGFPTAGCWEVTYTLDGHDPLRFVLRVR